MSNYDVIKAWKNPGYRNSLSAEQFAAMPANPAGTIEVDDSTIGHLAGAAAPQTSLCETKIACTMFKECSNLGCPTRLLC